MSRRYGKKTKSCLTPLSHLNQREDDKVKLPTTPKSDFQYFMQQFASQIKILKIIIKFGENGNFYCRFSFDKMKKKN
jgi:hypothetical protein